MKKRFIALAALALLLILGVAMAEGAKEVTFFCFSCRENRTGTVSDTYEYFDSTKHVQCIICQKCGYRGMTIATSHTESIAATCQSAAYCNVCNHSYGDPAEHNWGAWTKADENKHVRTCQNSGCNQSQYADHSGGNATCSTEGTCTDCGASYKDMDNHTGPYTYSYASSSATQYQHTVTETCTGCRQISDTNDEDHQLVSHDAKAPTCTTIGWDAYETCSRCDYTTYVEKSALGHDRVSHDAQAPTCTAIGWDAYETCSRCDYTTYVEKSALGHDRVSHDAQAPTCTAIGWDAYETCSRCDYTTYVEKSALGHDRVSHDAQAPTCTEIGWDAYETCSRCDYTTYVEKSELGHDRVNHDAKAPTCTTIGWNAYDTCSRCDYTTYAELPALGHDLVNHAAKAPTCTAIGWNAYDTCSRCSYTTYAELPALGHEYAAKAKKPTCTERGYTTHTCTRCHNSYRDAYVAALGHWYGEWTPNADGTNSATCLRDAYEHAVDCARFSFALTAEDVRTEFVLCPVCGEVSELRLFDENGEDAETLEDVQLLLVEDAAAEAITERLPAGELVLRMGALPSGEMLMSVAFEWGGEPTQPTGQVKITLPAELLDGYALCLLSEDGTETELALDVQEEEASFVLDFTDSLCPVQVIRLVPEV